MGADLADMQLISKFNKRFRFLLCLIDIISKYEWVIPLKDENKLQLPMLFKKSFHESNSKSKKMWVDNGSEF